MAEPTSHASSVVEERIVLSVRKTRRDLWVSVVLTITGLLLFAAFSLSEVRGSFGGADLLVTIFLAEIGSVLFFVGVIFVGINWWLLRRRVNGPAP